MKEKKMQQKNPLLFLIKRIKLNRENNDSSNETQ